jgi:hypothetical protein
MQGHISFYFWVHDSDEWWCGTVVAYYSGRQSTVALCTAMAETIALAKLVVKIKHMRVILFDLQCR